MVIGDLGSKHKPLLADTVHSNHTTSYVASSTTNTYAWTPLDKYVLVNGRVYPMFLYEGNNVGYINGPIHFKVAEDKYIEVFEDLPVISKEEALDKYPESFL